MIRPSSDVELMIRAAVVGEVDVSSSSWLLLTGWLILDVDICVSVRGWLNVDSINITCWLSDPLLGDIILYPQVSFTRSDGQYYCCICAH